MEPCNISSARRVGWCAPLLLLAFAGAVRGGDLQLKVSPLAPPAELPAEIRPWLQTNAIQLLDGDKPAFEFWFRTDVPLTAAPASPAKSLDTLKQPDLVGAARVAKDSRDYRDDELPAGLYTLRFGLQPSDGNHLGSSDYVYFLVLVPAKYDAKPAAIHDYKTLTKASSKDTSTGHPLIFSLRPVAGAPGETPSLQQPAPDHKAVRLRLPGRAGETKAEVIFDLVYEGKAPK